MQNLTWETIRVLVSIVGTLGVYTTGFVLDITHQDWTYVFSLNAGINVLGAIAFFALFDSKKEFE